MSSDIHACPFKSVSDGPEVHQVLSMPEEPAQLLIRDGDVLALEWKDVFQSN